MPTITAPIVAAYCEGLFSKTGGKSYIEGLKNSKFNTAILALAHPHYQDKSPPAPDAFKGDLYYNDTEIFANGKYVGPAEWIPLVNSLTLGETGIERVWLSIGGGGVGDYGNIQKLIAEYGTGEKNPLYQNLVALKNTFPAIEAIDLDDEEMQDTKLIVEFSRMLGKIGFHVTFCPYYNPDFWVGCLAELEKSDPGLVIAFNLQCYSGGAGNDPDDWIQALRQKLGAGFPASFVIPGVSTDSTPNQVQQQYAQWASDGIGGGFLWTYESAGTQAPDYAAAIATGLGTAAALRGSVEVERRPDTAR
ncbi:hypothetical protein K4L06_07090 [Lysobacter sp. BMK333-48F3]|uniref:hypothetical protein n=1 Tax=Lysobacter sp. BMK333-48F3 TaxID=2867962 RepID=UPI001C8BA1BF|nr:hypothetical protein [Lysobacter sp. BMK333-48F3]MBX9401074.1 hypothetical protein [Lysobacter sp. BMK333-48F3]